MRLMCTFYQKLAIWSELCWGSMISPIIHLALLKQNVATVDQVFLEASGFNQILPALEGTIIFVHYFVKVHLLIQYCWMLEKYLDLKDAH